MNRAPDDVDRDDNDNDNATCPYCDGTFYVDPNEEFQSVACPHCGFHYSD